MPMRLPSPATPGTMNGANAKRQGSARAASLVDLGALEVLVEDGAVGDGRELPAELRALVPREAPAQGRPRVSAFEEPAFPDAGPGERGHVGKRLVDRQPRETGKIGPTEPESTNEPAEQH